MNFTGYRCMDCNGLVAGSMKGGKKTYVYLGAGKYRCTQCHEEVLDRERQAQAIEEARAKEHWDSIQDLFEYKPTEGT